MNFDQIPNDTIRASLDDVYRLGKEDGEQRVGMRKLITALLGQLKDLRDEPIILAVQLVLAEYEGENLCAIDERYDLGVGKANHRLRLREMVATIRERLNQQIAKHPEIDLVLKAKTLLYSTEH